LQSQAFLSQVEKLKGMGALSENEGKKLASAIGSLNTDMSDDALRKSLSEVKVSLEESKVRLERKFGKKEEQAGNSFVIDGFQVEVE